MHTRCSGRPSSSSARAARTGAAAEAHEEQLLGYWANTTYVNHASAADVAEAIVAVCTSEGMAQVAAPAQRARLLVEPMQYDRALYNDLWGLAVFPGADSWTVLQTAPLELLAERAPGASRMRLADVCVRLAAGAFQLNVYDSTAILLAEVAGDGAIAVSGFNPANGLDPLEWHGERIDEEHYEAQFRLHPFQPLIAGGLSGEDMARVIARHFGGANAAFCDNLVSVDTLISHKPFAAPGGSVLYFRWPGASRQRMERSAAWPEV